MGTSTWDSTAFYRDSFTIFIASGGGKMDEK
jgi:hypothetical protein